MKKLITLLTAWLIALNVMAQCNISITHAVTDPSNCGVSDGSINITGSGGTAPYSFLWNNGMTTEDASGLDAGIYFLTVTDNNSCIQKDTIIVQNTSANVLSVNSNSPVCEFSNLNLSASLSTAVSYEWYGPNNFYSTNQNPTIPNITQASQGRYFVIATDPNGCKKGDVINILVAPLPFVSASNNSAICEGDTLNLFGNQNAITYTWTGPNGFSSTVQSPVVLSASSALNGTFTLTVSDVNGCVNSDNTNVIINSAPVATASSNAPCAGDTLYLIGGPSGMLEYTWTSTYCFAVQNPTIPSPSTNFTGQYTFTVTDSNGCKDSTTINVSVNPLPTANAGPDVTICLGTSVTLNGSGGQSCVWGNSSSLNSTTICNPTANPIVNTDYVLTVTDGSCTDTDTITIFVDDLQVSISGQTTFCGFDGTTLSAAVTGGAQVISYSWNSGETTQSIFTNAVSNYEVTVVDINGCTDTGTVLTQFFPHPFVSNVSSNSPVCEGSDLIISSSAWNGTAPYTFTISGPGGIVTTAVANFPNALPSMSGDYEIKTTDSNGCWDVDSISVIVNPSPVGTLVLDTLICQGEQISLLGSGTGGTQPYEHRLSVRTYNNNSYNYQIDPASNNNLSSTLNYTYGGHAEYFMATYILKDVNGCKDSISQMGDYIDDCVFPGDANYDMTADNMDLLNIGLGYGSTGPVRSNTSIVWEGHAAADWSQQFIGGVNYKQADCNGDGVINDSDTTAIQLNYGQVHAKTNSNVSSSGPVLAVNFPSGNHPAGSPISAPVTLGTTNNPANNVYGIAFTLSYPANAIDEASANVKFNNSWLGTDLLTLSHKNTDNTIDVAISRKDHLSLSGSGEICSFDGITIGNVAGKTDTVTTVVFEISNVRLIDNTGVEQPYSVQNDSVQIGSVGIKNNEAKENNLQVFPNPANTTLYVQADLTLTKIEIRNLTGELVMQENSINSNRHKLDIGSLAKAIYVVTCVDVNNNVSHIKVVKQ